ncbi:GTP-binding protein [Candidatus Vidania fulgoroideorum]
MFISNDPIISCSTCYKCRAGISGIRISLCNSLLAKKIICYITNRDTILFPRLAKFSYFYLDGNKVDSGIIILFPKGNSFTGEIVIEIYTHGNYSLVNNIITRIISRFSCYGLRLSKKGEFLKRSYYNGKTSFSELIRLYHLLSKNPISNYNFSFIRSSKLLYNSLNYIISSFSNIILYLENYINFSLDGSNFPLFRVFGFLRKLLTNFRGIKINNFYIFREYINICIVGHENVGKSSIFNALLGKSISIVSRYKGTTRNSICKTFLLSSGLKVNLFDTAGFNCRNNTFDININDNILSTLNVSNLIISVSDINFFRPFPVGFNVINVLNKVDLVCKKVLIPRGIIFTSCSLNIGISYLKTIIRKKIFCFIKTRNCFNSKRILVLSRLSKLILSLLDKDTNIDLISTLSRKFLVVLVRLFNIDYKESICDEIFKNFCIGK